MGMRLTLGFGIFPFDQVEPSRSRIITENHQNRPPSAIRNTQTTTELFAANLVEIANHVEAEGFVELESTVEVRTIYVDMQNTLEHGSLLSCENRAVRRPPPNVTMVRGRNWICIH